jgi:endogenous inhibitor of DNA gyrase (YacG/DUF329 family)
MPTFECPICKKAITVAHKKDAPYRPFCSRRCKMVDLGRWLNGTYTIAEPLESDDLEQASEEGDDAT